MRWSRRSRRLLALPPALQASLPLPGITHRAAMASSAQSGASTSGPAAKGGQPDWCFVPGHGDSTTRSLWHPVPHRGSGTRESAERASDGQPRGGHLPTPPAFTVEESAAFRWHVLSEGVATCHRKAQADGSGVLSPLTPTTAWMIITVSAGRQRAEVETTSSSAVGRGGGEDNARVAHYPLFASVACQPAPRQHK